MTFTKLQAIIAQALIVTSSASVLALAQTEVAQTPLTQTPLTQTDVAQTAHAQMDVAAGTAATRTNEVFVPGPQGSLAGSYVDAGRTAPVMLILPGSGPTDRDGNNPMGVSSASYKLLAEALAMKGISTLRIDKRGMFGSAKAIPNADAVTVADYAADVAAWTKAAISKSGRDCVWIAGHSEGGLIALAAAQEQSRICGVILIASPGRNLADVLYEQIHANPLNAVIFADADRGLATLRAGQMLDVSAMHPALQGLFAPKVQGYLIDLFRYDPAALAKRVKQPLLIVDGGRDIQVKVEDANALAAAQPKAKRITIDAMTHTLKRADTADQAANLATYSNPSLPIMPELVDAIAAFIGK